MRPFQRFQARIKCELHFQCHCSVWLEREFVLLFVHYLPFTVFKCTCIIFLQDFQLFFFCSFRTHSWRHSRMFMEFEPHLIHFLHLLLRCHSRRLVSFIHKNDKRHCTSVGRRFSYTLLFCSTHHEAAGSEQRTVCTTLNLKLSTRFSTLNNVNNVNYAVLQSWILTKNAAYTFVRD